MSYSDDLRTESETTRKNAAVVIERLREHETFSVELLAVADHPDVPDDVKARLVRMSEALQSNDNSVRVVTAIVGLVRSDMLNAMADLADHLISREAGAMVKEHVKRLQAKNHAVRMAAVEGFASGDWSKLDDLHERELNEAVEDAYPEDQGDTGADSGDRGSAGSEGSAGASETGGGDSSPAVDGGGGERPAES